MGTYLRILKFALPYRWRVLAAVGCMLVLALATSAYAGLMGPLLKFLFTGEAGSTADLAKYVPSSWEVAGRLSAVDRTTLLAAVPAVIVGVSLLKGVAYFGQFYLTSMVGQRVIADLRRALFDHLLTLSPSFFTKRHSGDLLQRFSADVTTVDSAVTQGVVSYVRDGLTVVAMLATCFLLDWRMSLVMFGVVPITLFPVVRLTKKLKKVTSSAQKTGGELLEVVQETVSGMRVVQAYGMERWESERYVEANRRLIKILRRGFLARGFSSPLMEVMAAAGIALAIWWVGGRIVSGQLEGSKFISFVAAVMLLYQPIKQLGKQGQTMMQGLAAGERIFEILDTPTAVPDQGRDELPPFREVIRYEGVAFSYGDRPVLDDLSFEIRRGEMVALVGSSGGGKTTAANLLLRFWDPQGGRITIDGKDLRDVTQASLRAQLALVTQDTVLFNDTIRANIAYGRPDIPLAEVERAARLAQAHDFIVAQPQGYETRVGEKGVRLSGGQKQRLSIARAFLKGAPILVLDEATSALDAESEREVQRALDDLMSGADGQKRTTLVIAHRLSTIRSADKIVVIAGGRVVEVGSHDELVRRGGEYARLNHIYEGKDRPEAAATA